MQVDWINLCALFISILAFICTIYEIRTTHSAVASLRDATSGAKQDVRENNQKMFAEFTVTIRNYGIDLIDPKVAIKVIGLPRYGSYSFELSQLPENKNAMPIMSRGMIGVFGLKSYWADTTFEEGLILNAKGAKVYLVLRSQGYEAVSWRLNGWIAWLKLKWNNFAWAINMSFRREWKEEGQRWTHIPKLIPTFRFLTYFSVRDYFDCAKRIREHEDMSSGVTVP